MLIFSVVVAIIFSHLLEKAISLSFHHRVNYEHENGELLHLESTGRFADVIDFDNVTGIKRVLCRHDLIMIALEDHSEIPDWRVGQIILGGSKWNCILGESHKEHHGMYTKIRQIFHPNDMRTRLDIVTEQIGPLDIMEEANIRLRYTTHVHGVKRTKRYLSNMLTDLLNNINWNANVSLKVHYNLNNSADGESSNISLHRYTGLKNLINWDMAKNSNYTAFTDTLDKTFTWDCLSCYSVTQINYVFVLVIHKVNNKPVLKQYLSQMDSIVKINADFRMKFYKEATLTGSRILWSTPTTELINVTLAKAPKLPPVNLVVTSNNLVFAQVHGAVSGHAEVNTSFIGTGQYVLSHTLSEGRPAFGDVTTYNWTLNDKQLTVDTIENVNITASIFQTVVFNASVLWSGKDVSAILSPPAIITLKPTIYLSGKGRAFSKCYDSRLSIDGDFQITKATFLVQAFGLKIWDVLVANKFRKKQTIMTIEIGRICKALCGSPYLRGPPKTMEEMCGQMVEAISTNDPSFNRLHYLIGDDIYFTNDNYKEKEWCGNIHKHCINCDNTYKGSNCSKRYFSAKMATAISTLVEFIKVEFPSRRLVVVKGFSEKSSRFPNGEYGTSSLYYEGRAAKLSLSTDDMLQRETDRNIIQKVSQLAVCSGFTFVDLKRNSNFIEVGTTADNTVSYEEQLGSKVEMEPFASIINATAATGKITSSDCSKKMPSFLSVGETYPKNSSEVEICGDVIAPVTRFFNTKFDRLYQYTFDDVEFEGESKLSKWCGSTVRPCFGCNATSSIESWNVCANRMMTPRAALRLRRLAVLLKHQSTGVTVVQAFSEPVDGYLPNLKLISPLYREGRGLMLKLRHNSSINYDRLAGLAVCAGFDFVSYSNVHAVEVFVKPQEHFQSNFMTYPSGLIVTGVSVRNTDLQSEYRIPDIYANESRIPLLIDGQNDDIHLSENYKISDFKCPGFRFLRIDPSLVECLELASKELGQSIKVLSAFRVRSVNLDNIDTRVPRERFRFHVGQSLEIVPEKSSEIELIKLGISIMRICTPITRPQQRAIGIGCRKNKMYLDFHPLVFGKEEKYIELWDNGGTTTYMNLLPRLYTALKGGPIIVPFNKSKACRSPIGVEFSHLTFQLQQPAGCVNHDEKLFCEKTRKSREEQAHLLQERLSSAAGSNNLPRPTIIGEINACVVDTCGGCPGSGDAWDSKVHLCAKMVRTYIQRASRPFQSLQNRATFFNTGNHESTVHSLACHFGYVCVENIQLYSLLMPLITSKYRPDPSTSVEERLFTTEENPTPLLEIVTQEMAIRASGTVRVFLEADTDLSSLKNVLKVLMVQNTNVNNVEFHITKNLRTESIKAVIQRYIELWAGNTCNIWSRFAVAPFTIDVIPTHRHKRSVVQSAGRNHAKHTLRNWEYEWLSKI